MVKNSFNIFRANLHKQTPKIYLLYNNSNFIRLSKVLTKFNIHSIPIVNKNLNCIVKLVKDKKQKCDESNIVHQFNWKNCPATYIG